MLYLENSLMGRSQPSKKVLQQKLTPELANAVLCSLWNGCFFFSFDCGNLGIESIDHAWAFREDSCMLSTPMMASWYVLSSHDCIPGEPHLLLFHYSF